MGPGIGARSAPASYQGRAWSSKERLRAYEGIDTASASGKIVAGVPGHAEMGRDPTRMLRYEHAG